MDLSFIHEENRFTFSKYYEQLLKDMILYLSGKKVYIKYARRQLCIKTYNEPTNTYYSEIEAINSMNKQS